MMYQRESSLSYFPDHAILIHDSLIEDRLIKRLLHALIREQLLNYLIDKNILSIFLPINQKTIVVHEVHCFDLRTFNFSGKVFLAEDNHLTPLQSVTTLLNIIYPELKNHTDEKQWQRFTAEIFDSLRNESLVTHRMHRFNKKLVNTVQNAGFDTLMQYIQSHYSVQEQLMFFETWPVSGNQYNPAHKTKLGFSEQDFLQFSSEFNQDIQLPIAAIKRNKMHVESERPDFDYQIWFASQFPKQWADFKEELISNGLSLVDYYPIFIHPWQYDNVIKNVFKVLIDDQEIIFFRNITISAKPSLSFRTLISKEEGGQPNIKLAVAVQSTGAMRTISISAVENGPKISKILRKILTMENHFQQSLKCAYESCALHINHGDPVHQKNCGIIFRDNPSQLVRADQCAIVAAALFENSPVTQVPLFIELMQQAEGLSLSAALSYFAKHAEVILHGYLDLLLIYGITLEGHQQNTIVVFENNIPKFVIARDWGGVRIHAPTLKKHGFSYQSHPESVTITEDNVAVTYKFIHSVIQYQLGELVLILAKFFNTAENIFWKIVKTTIEKRLVAVQHRVETERFQQIVQALFQDDWKIKSLLHMRLSNIYNRYIYTTVKNPLKDI